MADKKKFLLRIDEKVYAALEKWAADDLRSINSQIEFLLTAALKNAGRLKTTSDTNNLTNSENSETNSPK
jgi:hypothetical protein